MTNNISTKLFTYCLFNIWRREKKKKKKKKSRCIKDEVTNVLPIQEKSISYEISVLFVCLFLSFFIFFPLCLEFGFRVWFIIFIWLEYRFKLNDLHTKFFWSPRNLSNLNNAQIITIFFISKNRSKLINYWLWLEEKGTTIIYIFLYKYYIIPHEKSSNFF